jgi:hypothetical protein
MGTSLSPSAALLPPPTTAANIVTDTLRPSFSAISVYAYTTSNNGVAIAAVPCATVEHRIELDKEIFGELDRFGIDVGKFGHRNGWIEYGLLEQLAGRMLDIVLGRFEEMREIA